MRKLFKIGTSICYKRIKIKKQFIYRKGKKKVKKILKYIIIGIVSFFLLFFVFSNLLRWTHQGEFLKYDNGVTIEVYNSSKEVITGLNFYFAFDGDHVYQDLGTITQLGPEETSSFYNHKIKDTGNDRSLYLQYPINKTETEFESLVYLHSNKPSKVVLILEITGTDNKGKL
ncbi:hypothetical protein MPH47_20460 [Psychrobacillus psychrodurans]|uniref:hypothetical protein n=1 Tax=Psychrobacillus psychrodurans TaxID=126157 RepID=UPI001F4DAFFC|nr:hypothetical protein [Psychrobacillus psychrodurans]MCK1999568.1 hypothetical protein [Psychrobacillus psychrodurans]